MVWIFAGDDALRQAFDDGGFADARLADQHRIVLGTAGQDLDDAADFLVAADHRVELAFLRGGRQIGGVLLQSFIRAFRVGAGHLAVAAARGGQGVTQLIRGKTVLFQDVRALIRFRGRDYVLKQIFGPIFESMLKGEIENHLGHKKHERSEDGDNVRNGYSSKTLKTSLGDATSMRSTVTYSSPLRCISFSACDSTADSCLLTSGCVVVDPLALGSDCIA